MHQMISNQTMNNKGVRVRAPSHHNGKTSGGAATMDASGR